VAQVEVEGERASKRPRKKVPVIRTLCEIPALGIAFEALFKVELRAGSGRHFAVNGSSAKDAVDLALACLELDISFS
jgi:hypothetical protein